MATWLRFSSPQSAAPNSSRRAWEYNFGLLEEYLAMRTRRGPIPVRLMYRGVTLGSWCSLQRNIYNHGTARKDGGISWRPRGQLSAEQIARLEPLDGWSWSALDDGWEERFERIAIIYRNSEVEKLTAKHREPDGWSPHQWSWKQRDAYHRGLLAAARRERLTALPGWKWGESRPSDVQLLDWLADFADKNGHLKVPVKAKLGTVAVRAWLARMNRRIADGTAPQEVESRLRAIPGWSIDVVSVPAHTKRDQARWLESFDRLRQMEALGVDIASIHTQATQADGFQIGFWITDQRRRYRMGRLAKERIELLETLSTWRWAVRDDLFWRGVEAAREFNAKHGHIRVPRGYTEGGFDLSFWIDKQRRKFHRGKLLPNQVQALSEIEGWNWAPHRPRRRREPHTTRRSGA